MVVNVCNYSTEAMSSSTRKMFSWRWPLGWGWPASVETLKERHVCAILQPSQIHTRETGQDRERYVQKEQNPWWFSWVERTWSNHLQGNSVTSSSQRHVGRATFVGSKWKIRRTRMPIHASLLFSLHLQQCWRESGGGHMGSPDPSQRHGLDGTPLYTSSFVMSLKWRTVTLCHSSVPIESDLSSHTTWEIEYSEEDKTNPWKSRENSH